jgi:hypothetical protein
MPQEVKEFSPQESLQLIQSMIEKTQHSISDKSHYFLLWGWAVFTGCVLQYWLKVVMDYPKHYYAWLVTPLALAVNFYFVIQDNKKFRVKTYISDSFKYLWTAIGLAFLVLMFLFSNIGWQYCYPFYVLFYAIGTYVSGSLIQFKPLKIGGMVCFPLAIITAKFSYDNQILLLALAIMISYIIPGYLLKLQFKRQHQ